MAPTLTDELDRNIPLYEMIQSLRQELKASIEAAKEEPLQFEVEEAELELRVTVKRDANIKGKIHFWVAKGEGNLGKTQEDVHVFKLKLKPVANDTKGKTPNVIRVKDQPTIELRE